MYRGIKGTYVYVCDKKLREYFQKHLQVFKTPNSFEILPESKVIPFQNAVPFYDLQAAAASFSELQNPEYQDWLKLPDQFSVDKDFFACQVIGESMNKKIPNGSICLFRKDPGGSRNGKIVLVEHTSFMDKDFGSGFTIKEYHSEKVQNEHSWHHSQIVLRPLSTNPAFEEIFLKDEDLDGLRVVGVFVCVVNF
jgi:SOS-response transcriptional repressor LexA